MRRIYEISKTLLSFNPRYIQRKTSECFVTFSLGRAVVTIVLSCVVNYLYVCEMSNLLVNFAEESMGKEKENKNHGVEKI